MNNQSSNIKTNTENVKVAVQTDDFDVAFEWQQLRNKGSHIGAITNFIGLMRDINQGDTVSGMFLEHYPGMTESCLHDIVKQAQTRWVLQGITVIHRVGELLPSDQIVFVAVASEHRKEAFSACEFIMDYLKTQAPFWKKEQTTTGNRWVDAKQSDEDTANRW
jgi:molybdopterin synthase catalytic subunit